MQRNDMEFGILFTSQPHTEREKYPHQNMHARVTAEILEADKLGFDCAWLAEHHFSNDYGVMPDVWVYAAYLAPQTKRIKLGTAVVTLPLSNPVRVAENAAFVDILSGGRAVLGVGSGYRPYEFEGLGVDFETRRDISEEGVEVLRELFLNKRVNHQGKHVHAKVDGPYELFPHALQQPHPPLYMAGATERSIGAAGRMGMGLMLSSLTPFEGLKKHIAVYREGLEQTPAAWRGNPARGHVDVNRWFYLAETDEQARRDSEEGLIRHLKHYFGGQTSGYLGQVAQGKDAVTSRLEYDALSESTILHGSPKTVIAKLERLREMGATSVMLHYPPWYGTEKSVAALRLFAQEVMPKFKSRVKAKVA
jgi:alkanesulfonate monooxygenase SsuD/methylene tetrahydromethanopterin reductase-like flavin-dependent oxidoreductase (luciferase family)